jgi:hypothetical protein
MQIANLLQPRRVIRRPKNIFCGTCYDIVLYPRSPEAEFEKKKSRRRYSKTVLSSMEEDGNPDSSDYTPDLDEDISTWFENVMLGFILINTVALAAQYFGQVIYLDFTLIIVMIDLFYLNYCFLLLKS